MLTSTARYDEKILIPALTVLFFCCPSCGGVGCSKFCLSGKASCIKAFKESTSTIPTTPSTTSNPAPKVLSEPEWMALPVAPGGSTRNAKGYASYVKQKKAFANRSASKASSTVDMSSAVAYYALHQDLILSNGRYLPSASRPGIG
jgi:hypothetical protein